MIEVLISLALVLIVEVWPARWAPTSLSWVLSRHRDRYRVTRAPTF